MSKKHHRNSAASRIIAKFGGIRPMAAIVKRPHSTIQSWEVSGFIPARQQVHILKVARKVGIDVRPDDFFSAFPTLDTAAAE